MGRSGAFGEAFYPFCTLPAPTPTPALPVTGRELAVHAIYMDASRLQGTSSGELNAFIATQGKGVGILCGQFWRFAAPPDNEPHRCLRLHRVSEGIQYKALTRF